MNAAPVLRWLALAVAVEAVMIVVLCGGPDETRDIIRAWTLPALPRQPAPDLQGKRVLITGANRGYGFAAAFHFARAGAAVVLACRSGIPDAGLAVAREAAGGGSAAAAAVSMQFVDLQDFASIRALAGRLDAPLDYVVLNAAVVNAEPRPLPGHGGRNQMFVVNFLSNVVLVRALADAGALADGARLLYVGSGTHRKGGVRGGLGDRAEFGWTGALAAYGQTKFLTQVFVDWLPRRTGPGGIDLRGRGITVATHSPGPVFSSLGQQNVPWFLLPFYHAMKALVFPSAAAAAEPLLRLADVSATPDGTFLDIRVVASGDEGLELVRAESTFEWLRRETDAVLGYPDLRRVRTSSL